MSVAKSRLTAQGQISVPAEVRKRLGVGPGSVLEWDELDGRVIVRKAARNTSLDVHEALFGGETPKVTTGTKEGIRKYIRKRHARG
jgi:AbrB family looped-hinge helix DNA binding protein